MIRNIEKTDGEEFLYTPKISSNPDLNIWMAFPAIKNFGMAALGFLNMFKILDTNENYFAERIFTDTEKTKLLYKDIDVIFFSFVFELDFLQILKIFDKYSIPYKASDRDGAHPLIIAGGPVMCANPEPFCEFFDGVIVGDAENFDNDILGAIKSNKGKAKSEILQNLAQIEGMYIPSLTEFNEKTRQTTINGKEFFVKRRAASLEGCVSTPILCENSFFKRTYVMEVARGCPMRCGFCLASYMTLPTRFSPYEKIIENIEFGLKHTDKIALLGALISAHPQFDKICEYIYNKAMAGENFSLSVSSLRADLVSDISVKMLVACGQRHSTIAIEAGSERLRKVINKNLSNEQIKNAVRVCQKNGLKGLKIYAMIGLPTETQEDLQELVDLIKSLKQEFKGFDFSLSFATFVPKAQTPFQFTQRDNSKSLDKKYEFLKKQFAKIGVQISTSSVKWDYYQALLARADRRAADYLIEVYKQGGNLGAFKNVYKDFYKEGKLPDSDCFALNALETDGHLPWEYIVSCVNKDDLIKEYRRLLPN